MSYQISRKAREKRQQARVDGTDIGISMLARCASEHVVGGLAAGEPPADARWRQELGDLLSVERGPYVCVRGYLTLRIILALLVGVDQRR